MSEPKYNVMYTNRFYKDYKLAMKRGFDVLKIDEIVRKLAMDEKLPAKNKDHVLSGDWSGYRECHVDPDWLLVYKKEEHVLILTLFRTGTHSDIFG